MWPILLREGVDSWGGQQKEEEIFKGKFLGWDWGLYHVRRSSNVLLAAVGTSREDLH